MFYPTINENKEDKRDIILINNNNCYTTIYRHLLSIQTFPISSETPNLFRIMSHLTQNKVYATIIGRKKFCNVHNSEQ